MTVKIRGLLENFISLSVLQGMNMLLPLITFPYLFKTLGVETFGIIALSLAVIGYFNILVSFGFELSATKDISLNRNDNARLSEIFSIVLSVKILLGLIAFFILIISSIYVDFIINERLLYFVSFGLVLGNILFPSWFFQGIEKMKFITIISVISKFIYTILVFILIRTKNDYILVAILGSGAAIFNGIIGLYIIFKKFEIRFRWMGYNEVLIEVKRSYLYFVSRVSNHGSRYLVTTVIGAYFGATLVGYYSLVEKLFYAFTTIGSVISQVLYPYVSRTGNIDLVRKVFLSTVIFTTLLSMTVIRYNQELLYYIFDVHNEMASAMIKIVFLFASVNIASAIIGFPVLGALGYDTEANTSLVYASMLGLLYLMIMIMYSTEVLHFVFTLGVYSISSLVLRILHLNRLGLLARVMYK